MFFFNLFSFVAVEKLNIFCLKQHIQILTLVFYIVYFVMCISCRWENSWSFTGFLKNLPKNMAFSAVQKLWRKCQNPFPAILRRKKN